MSKINYPIVQDTIPEASHWPEKQCRICAAIHIFYVISDNLVRYVHFLKLISNPLKTVCNVFETWKLFGLRLSGFCFSEMSTEKQSTTKS